MRTNVGRVHISMCAPGILTKTMLGRVHICFIVSNGIKTMHVENKNSWPLIPDEFLSDEMEALHVCTHVCVFASKALQGMCLLL
jgi:hypothetical protein